MGLSDLKLFLPELYLLFLALLFFAQSLWQSPARVNQLLALWLSAIGVGDQRLVPPALRRALFSHLSGGSFFPGLQGPDSTRSICGDLHRPGFKKYRRAAPSGIFHVFVLKFPGVDAHGQQRGTVDYLYRHGAVLLFALYPDPPAETDFREPDGSGHQIHHFRGRRHRGHALRHELSLRSDPVHLSPGADPETAPGADPAPGRGRSAPGALRVLLSSWR